MSTIAQQPTSTSMSFTAFLKTLPLLQTWACRNTYTCEDFCTSIASWVVNKCHPFAIIEDQELHDLFCMLDP